MAKETGGPLRSIIFIICSLFLFIASLGCSTAPKHSYEFSYKNLILDRNQKSNVTQLTKLEFTEDIALLKYGIGKAYGASRLVSSNTFTRVYKKLDGLRYFPNPDKLCDQIGGILNEFPDSHLEARLGAHVCSKRKIDYSDVGANINKTNSHWTGKIFTRKGKKIAAIGITTFAPGTWNGFIDFINKAKSNSDVFIIDLRGNGGGDDSNGQLLAETLAGQKIQNPYGNIFHRQTPETLTIWDNYLKYTQERFKEDRQAVEKIESYIAQNKALLRRAINNEISDWRIETPVSSVKQFDRSLAFQGAIYILQDKKCGSSCESTIDYFEYFPNMKRVGTSTYGMLHFGNIGVFKLPNSGISVQMPTKTNTYKDNRFIELKGIEPDIQLEAEQDAFKYVLTELL